MGDALLMRGFERFRDLFSNRERFIYGNRTLRNSIRERLALD